MSTQSVDRSEQAKSLQFNVAQQLKEQGGIPRKYTVENALIPNLSDDLVLLAPLAGHVKLTKTDTGILVTAAFTTTLQLACTRCLTPVASPVTLTIEETFTPTRDLVTGDELPPEEDIDTTILIDEQHILDLTAVVIEELQLSQPTQVLCLENCLGLCPQCGQNKNQALCNCEENNTDIRWADLLALKNQ